MFDHRRRWPFDDHFRNFSRRARIYLNEDFYENIYQHNKQNDENDNI